MSLVDDVPNAAKLLNRVLNGQPIENALAPENSSYPIPPRVKAWVYGVCRYYFSLSEQLSGLLSRPIDRLDAEVKGVLFISAFRIRDTNTPQPIVVSAAVEATKRLKKMSASGLVNAVLRKVHKDYSAKSAEAQFELPNWLQRELSKAYDSAEARSSDWLPNLTVQMPHMLRVNSMRISPDRLMAAFREADIDFTPTDHALGIRLKTPQVTASLPGYKEGWFSTQDANAQRAVHLLQAEPGMRVLDACAAPGNKALQILDQFPECQLTAIDINKSRSRFSQAESRRLRTKLTIRQADATRRDWWDGIPFDRILIDAPCSATGTIARRPDVKLHRTPSQIGPLRQRQLDLLNGLIPLLSSEGHIIYSTCSLLPHENDSVLAQFTRDHPDVVTRQPDFPTLDPAVVMKQEFGTQLLPTPEFGDGFYFSKLTRATNST